MVDPAPAAGPTPGTHAADPGTGSDAGPGAHAATGADAARGAGASGGDVPRDPQRDPQRDPHRGASRAEVATLVRLTLSAFVVLAAQPAFVLVDTAVVGHLGRDALAGLGAAGTVMSLLTVVGTSLEYGTTSRAARAFGAGRRTEAVAEGVQAGWLGVGFALVALALGETFAGPLCRAVTGGAGPAAVQAELWLRAALPGLPAMMLVLAANGWMRGVQDTRSPVRMVLVAGAVSTVLSPLLVYPCGLGTAGSALANVVGQCTGAVLALAALHRERAGARPVPRVMVRQLVVGRDLVLRAAAFQVSYLVAAAVAGRLGAAQLAAHQVGLQLWAFTALLLDSFAVAAQSLVGAALGAGDADLARRTAWRVARHGTAFGAVAAVVASTGHGWVPWVFSSDPAVQAQIRLLWPWLVAMMPAAGLVFALDGVLLGAGDHAWLRTLTVVGALGGYVPVALLAPAAGAGLGGVWAGLAVFVGVRLVGVVLRTRGGAWAVTGR